MEDLQLLITNKQAEVEKYKATIELKRTQLKTAEEALSYLKSLRVPTKKDLQVEEELLKYQSKVNKLEIENKGLTDRNKELKTENKTVSKALKSTEKELNKLKKANSIV